MTPDRRAVLHRRIRLLVAATITYNVIEAVVAITAGTVASSVALVGLGLDSVIEVGSAAAVAWQFAGPTPERRERTTLRVISWSFFALAAYVAVESLRALLGAGEADRSIVGIVLVAVSVAVMPVLSLVQRRAGRELGSATAVADSKQTLLCTYLSAAVLVGLALNATLGWWWADPVAGLVLAALAVREGLAARHGDACCAPSGRTPTRARSTPAAHPPLRRAAGSRSTPAPSRRPSSPCASTSSTPCSRRRSAGSTAGNRAGCGCTSSGPTRSRRRPGTSSRGSPGAARSSRSTCGAGTR